MALQPFGYPFEILSPLSPDEAKARIRRRAKGWFEQKNGARGWILGSLVCLWWTGITRGPMLIGWISSDPSGARITGRAGSDLNGVIGVTLIGVAFLFVPLVALLTGRDATEALRSIPFMAAIFIPLWLLGVWLRNAMHVEADPLVRFVRNATAPSRRTPSATAPLRTLTLIVNETTRTGVISAAELQEALSETGPNDILILEAAPEDYIQTRWTDGGFTLERRDGGADRHFRAETEGGQTVLEFEDILGAFTAWAEGTRLPAVLKWKALRLPD
ncbi:hypothetical protein [Brevundimonas sp.]|jgi:hypothetical protein|uniref:hypothetical protein n=1 Tax=Brevundimonas sp. TaxID=1871086 RepID=UPI0025BDECBF|nr:hypothetical protein [Brevundimonas sp.]